MRIKVKPVKGEELDVDIDESESIETLKVIIITMSPGFEDTEPDDLKLIFKGSQLKDGSQTIDSTGMKEGDFVVLMGKKKDAASKPGAEAAPAAAVLAPPAQAPAPSVPAPAPASIAAQVAGSVTGPPPEAAVNELCSMGFPRDQVLKAFAAAYNNPDRAASFLVEGNIPPLEEALRQPLAPAAAAPGISGVGQATSGSWAQQLLGAQLLTKSGLQPTAQVLEGRSCVLLYFSAHWCPPCQRFTPMLASAFSALGAGQTQVQVVFVSSDRDLTSHMHYYATMPWTALPFGSPQKEMLSAMFGIRGIPALVALDGNTGRALDASARDTLSRSGFNLAACCATWGFSLTAPSATPCHTAPAAAAEAAAPAVPPKKPEPAPAAIDVEATKSALSRVAETEWAIQEAFYVTLLKVLNNTLQNPAEAKFRSLKKGNAALQAKLFGVGNGAATALLVFAGFQDGEEAISLPEAPDGRCTAVRDEVQTHADAQKMKELRRERDAKIADEIKKDQNSHARYSGGGGDGGRMELGTGRKKSGGG